MKQGRPGAALRAPGAAGAPAHRQGGRAPGAARAARADPPGHRAQVRGLCRGQFIARFFVMCTDIRDVLRF